MRKNIAKIALILLIVALAVTLVACNGDNSDASKPSQNGKPEVTSKAEVVKASEYFDRLWTLTESFGAQEISENADIALKADMALELGTKSLSSKKPVQSLEFGVQYELVLDRTSKDIEGNYNSKKSAVKLKVYSGDIEVCAIYFFVKDPTRVFFDFDGKQVVVSADLAGLNGKLGGALGGWLYGEDEDGNSVNGMLNMFLGAMGPDSGWSLNTPINQLLEMSGIPLKQMLKDDEDMQKLLALLLAGNDVDMLFDGEDINILSLIKSDVVSGMISAEKSEGDGVTEYVATLTGGSSGSVSLGGVMSGPMGDMVNEVLNGMGGILELASKATAQIGFTEKGGAFDSLYLNADFAGMAAGQEPLLDANGVTRVYPYFRCIVKDIELGAASDYTLGIKATDYSSEVAFEFANKMSIQGISVQEDESGAEEAPELAASAEEEGQPVTVEARVIGVIDLMGVGSANRTRMNAYIAVDGEHIIDVGFNATTLAIVPNLTFADGAMKDVLAAAGSGIYKIFEMFGIADGDALARFADAFFGKDEQGDIDFDTLNSNLNGILVQGFDIGATFQRMAQKMADMFIRIQPDDGGEHTAPAEPSEPAEPEEPEEQPQIPDISQYMPYLPTYKQIFAAAKAVVRSLKMQNGVVQFSNADIVDFMLTIVNMTSEEELTREQLKDEVVAEMSAMLQENGKQLAAYYDAIFDAVSALRIEGVTPFVAERTEDPAADAMTAINYLVDLLLEKPIGVKCAFDYTDGAALSVEVTLGSAKLNYSASLNAYAITDGTFEDLGAGHGETDGYVVIDLATLSSNE